MHYIYMMQCFSVISITDIKLKIISPKTKQVHVRATGHMEAAHWLVRRVTHKHGSTAP